MNCYNRWVNSLAPKWCPIALLLLTVLTFILIGKHILVEQDESFKHLPKPILLEVLLSNVTQEYIITSRAKLTAGDTDTQEEILYLPLPKPLFYEGSGSEIPGLVTQEDLSQSPFVDPPIPDQEDGSKLILLYTWGYTRTRVLETSWGLKISDDLLYYEPHGTFPCRKKCKITMFEHLAPQAHAVLFHIWELTYGVAPPPRLRYRSDRQVWVAYTVESPAYYDQKESVKSTDSVGMATMFNWTFTHRLDSDVYFPYGYFYTLPHPKTLEEVLPTRESFKKKLIAAALISHCETTSKREVVIAELQKYLQIDVYGGCGKTHEKCTRRLGASIKCRNFLAQNYKFYLAFENQLCQDYITEKFFEAFHHGLVPVAYGLGDYTEVAPPGSYINALDFTSLEALAKYLMHLDKNDEEYFQYFKWKITYGLRMSQLSSEVIGSTDASFCNLCTKLWEPQSKKQRILDFDKWWDHKRTPSQISKAHGATYILNNSNQSCVYLQKIPFLI